jgi:stage V sporulation protein SpoVS
MPKYEGIKREPALYTPHEGTLKIAGDTIPGRAAGRAICLLKQDGIEVIDFFLIGGSANQQAMKAMSLFKIFLEDDSEQEVTLAFAPIHVITMAKSKTGGPEMTKMDATVWRTVVLTREQSEKVVIKSPEEAPQMPLE